MNRLASGTGSPVAAQFCPGHDACQAPVLPAGSGRSTMRILYFYLMGDTPDRVRAVAPRHTAYWGELELDHYLGGPFADRSGGLITFEAGSLWEAGQLGPRTPSSRRIFWSGVG
jgi:hypothetical protein